MNLREHDLHANLCVQLPPKFHKTIGLLRSADLLIVMGTSLKVHPFATLTNLVPESCPRVLINLDPAGDIGTRADDVVLLGKTDDVVRDLCKELGEEWVDELDALWKETAQYGPSPEQLVSAVEKEEVEVLEEAGKPEVAAEAEKKAEEAAKQARVEDEVEKLAEQIAKSLELGAVTKEESKAETAQPSAEVATEKKAGESIAEGVKEKEVEKVEGKAEVVAVTATEPSQDSSKDVIAQADQEKVTDAPTGQSSVEKTDEKPAEGKL